jgi:hypothetical protein
MEGAVPAGSRRLGPLEWLRRYPGAVTLFLALIAGLLVLPNLAHLFDFADILISSRVSVIHLIWLVLALVLSVLAVRSLMSFSDGFASGIGNFGARRLGDTTKPGVGVAGRSAANAVELSQAMVQGVFGLIGLILCQAFIRKPLVVVGRPFAQEAWVDGGFVAVVVLLAIFMLVRLYRSSRPVVEQFVWTGLDDLVPTAGYLGGDIPTASTRSKSTRSFAVPTPSSQDAPVAARGGSAAAAGVTIARGDWPGSSSSDATVVAPGRQVAFLPAEVTIAAASDNADVTIVAPQSQESEKPVSVPDLSVFRGSSGPEIAGAVGPMSEITLLSNIEVTLPGSGALSGDLVAVPLPNTADEDVSGIDEIREAILSVPDDEPREPPVGSGSADETFVSSKPSDGERVGETRKQPRQDLA